MATVQETLSSIENKTGHIPGSLIVHSMDEKGAVIKWLEDNAGAAERKKMFLQLDPNEKDLAFEQRTTILMIDVEPAGG